MHTRFATLVVLAAVWASATVIQAKQTKWEPVGLSGGGGLAHPSISPHDPETMLVESDMGGRYISHDAGKTWAMIHRKQITSAFGGCPPLFHPNKKGVIYALSPVSRIHESRDNGKTWKIWPVDRQPEIDAIRQMFIDPATGRLEAFHRTLRMGRLRAYPARHVARFGVALDHRIT